MILFDLPRKRTVNVIKQCIVVQKSSATDGTTVTESDTLKQSNNACMVKIFSLRYSCFRELNNRSEGILCVTNNKKYKLDLFEIPHLLQPCCESQYCIFFVLTRAIVKNNIQLTAS